MQNFARPPIKVLSARVYGPIGAINIYDDFWQQKGKQQSFFYALLKKSKSINIFFSVRTGQSECAEIFIASFFLKEEKLWVETENCSIKII